jgi:MFS family permease
MCLGYNGLCYCKCDCDSWRVGCHKFGRRNYFAVSIIIFTVASFMCGNANNIWELVAFRFIQG